MLAFLLASLPGAALALAAADSYAPLQLYAGKWAVAMSDGKRMSIANHCARIGLFFACEQVIDSKAQDLVVFLPTAAGAGGFTYRTQALGADGTGSHPWTTLTIDGDHWVYASDPGKAGGPRDRTLNRFSGRDHIHFDVQTSPDGEIWTTTLSGEESRVR